MPNILPRFPARPKRRHPAPFAPPASDTGRLKELAGIKDNPGKLRGLYHVPEGLEGPAPLVVVLHGCTQSANVYDVGSGWSTLADRHGFILLFPEQRRANNPMLCFNWFSPNDSQRGMGEPASVRSMIDALDRVHPVDRDQIFVTGLSAGGAMASVMLATYPEVFAAGAMLAGIAYGCAADVGGAFDCMGGRAKSDSADLARHVRRASPHKGPWPRVQVWQGSADGVVVPSNADAIVLQWANLHGLETRPDRSDEVGGHKRRTWTGPKGEKLIEQYIVAGMAHGVPLDGGAEDPLGAAGAHMLDVGLSSTARIAAFFGIAPEEIARPEQARGRRNPPPAEQFTGPQAMIEKALRSAGLIR